MARFMGGPTPRRWPFAVLLAICGCAFVGALLFPIVVEPRPNDFDFPGLCPDSPVSILLTGGDTEHLDRARCQEAAKIRLIVAVGSLAIGGAAIVVRRKQLATIETRPSISRRTVLKVLAIGVVLYLLIGIGFANAIVQDQTWVCPDPSAPHGETTGNVKRSADCRPLTPESQRWGHGVWVALAWPIFLV